MDYGIVYFDAANGTDLSQTNTYFNNDHNGAESFGYGKQAGVNTSKARSKSHKNIAQNVFSKFADFWKKNKSYSWPDNTMAKMLPKPEGKITYLSTGSSYLSADVDCDLSEYKKYVESCEKKGFTEEKDES